MKIIHNIESVSTKKNVYSINGYVHCIDSTKKLTFDEIEIELFLENKIIPAEKYVFQVDNIKRSDLSFVYGDDDVYVGFEAKCHLERIKELQQKDFHLFICITIKDEKHSFEVKMPNYFYYEFDPEIVFKITNLRPEVKRLLDTSLDNKIINHFNNENRFLIKNKKLQDEDFLLFKKQLKLENQFVEISLHTELFEEKEVTIKVFNWKYSSGIIKGRNVRLKLPNFLLLLFSRFYIQISSNELIEFNAQNFIKETDPINKFIFKYKSSAIGWFLLKNKLGRVRRR